MDLANITKCFEDAGPRCKIPERLGSVDAIAGPAVSERKELQGPTTTENNIIVDLFPHRHLSHLLSFLRYAWRPRFIRQCVEPNYSGTAE